MTIAKRLITALEARGYTRLPERRTQRYIELRNTAGCRALLKGEPPPIHRVLVGPNGAIRWTTTSVAMSRRVSARLVQKLLAEGEAK